MARKYVPSATDGSVGQLRMGHARGTGHGEPGGMRTSTGGLWGHGTGLADALSLPPAPRCSSSSFMRDLMPKTEEYLLLLPSIFMVGGACEDCVSDPNRRCQNQLRTCHETSWLGLHPAASGQSLCDRSLLLLGSETCCW